VVIGLGWWFELRHEQSAHICNGKEGSERRRKMFNLKCNIKSEESWSLPSYPASVPLGEQCRSQPNILNFTRLSLTQPIAAIIY
jgi:hypothetical protein